MLFRDPDGNEIPTGKVSKELVENFLLPSAADPNIPQMNWMTVDSGKIILNPTTTSQGYAKISTDPFRGYAARLQTIQQFNTEHFTELAFTVEGFQINGNIEMSVQISLKGVDCGIALFQNVNQVGATLRVYGAGAVTNDYKTHLSFFGFDEGQNRKNITLRLLTGMQYAKSIRQPVFVYVQADDQIGFEQEITPHFRHGLVRGLAQVTTSADKTKYMNIAQAKMRLVHN